MSTFDIHNSNRVPVIRQKTVLKIGILNLYIHCYLLICKYVVTMRKTVLLPIAAVLCVSCALFLCDDVSCGETDPFRCGESATYIFDPDTGLMTIEGIGPMYDYLDDQPWKSYRESIKAIRIGNEITGIGAYAFYGCTPSSRYPSPIRSWP